MGTIKGKFDVRKRKEIILPSGVKMGIASLQGRHQALITNQNDKKREEGFEEMLLSCIDYIGEKNNLTLKDIQRLYEGDRKFALLELRKLSNRDKNTFTFIYEFPTEGGKKLQEKKVVDFDKQNFPVFPYHWVVKSMLINYKEEHNITRELTEDEIKEAQLKEFPVIYDSYKEMRAANDIVELKLPESEIDITWKIQNGEDTKKKAKYIDASNTNSHTQLELHNPMYIEDASGKDVNTPVPLDKLSLIDIEALRFDIMDKEATIDTTIVVQYKDDVRKQQQLDLISMPAFFFPSLAL